MKLWSVCHEVVDTDHYVYTTTLVAARDKAEVVKFFNNKLLPKNPTWWSQRKINSSNVLPADVYFAPSVSKVRSVIVMR